MYKIDSVNQQMLVAIVGPFGSGPPDGQASGILPSLAQNDTWLQLATNPVKMKEAWGKITYNGNECKSSCIKIFSIMSRMGDIKAIENKSKKVHNM